MTVDAFQLAKLANDGDLIFLKSDRVLSNEQIAKFRKEYEAIFRQAAPHSKIILLNHGFDVEIARQRVQMVAGDLGCDEMPDGELRAFYSPPETIAPTVVMGRQAIGTVPRCDGDDGKCRSPVSCRTSGYCQIPF